MQPKRGRSFFYFRIFTALILFFAGHTAYAQANDNCSNASPVVISASGFGTGVFTSPVSNIGAATVQPGETFAPAILVAGQSQKSIWYKFTISTTRAVRVTLAQNGSAIAAGDIGFAVYKTNSCLPSNAQISTKLTPIGLFGNTFHPCVDAGEYLIQVSAKNAANGPVYIEVEVDHTNADYDKPADAYDFGTLAPGIKAVDFTVSCQSLEDGNEICNTLYNYQSYKKSTWHVFKTPAYFDYLAFVFSHPTNLTGLKVGYKLYEGDVRSTSYSTLPVIDGCDSLLLTTSNYAAIKSYKCDELDPNKTYSIQLFYPEDFNEEVRIGMTLAGFSATQAPQPITANIPSPSNALGVLPSSGSGVTTLVTDQLGCNSRIATHPCSPSMPAAGVEENGNTYTLTSFFTFTLSTSSNVTFNAYFNNYSCGNPLRLRLFYQSTSASCTSLDTSNIVARIPAYSDVLCLDAGTYTLQVLGQDHETNNYYSSGYIYNTTTPLCLFNNLGSQFSVSMNVRSVAAINEFSLATPGAYDTINRVSNIMQPLDSGIVYTSQMDTFACENTVLPWDTTCGPSFNKAIYREFAVDDSGFVRLRFGGGWGHQTKVYKGDANALAMAQNVHAFPQEISGIDPVSKCLYQSGCGAYVCVDPGTYTHVSFGSDATISQYVQSTFKFDNKRTKFRSPALALDMGDLMTQVPATGGSIQAEQDYFTCWDNAEVINGTAPCTISGQVATKAIYRMFYLSQPANINISGYHYDNDCGSVYGGYMTLFKGKATDGLNTLTEMPSPWKCFLNASVNGCDALQPGWYTLVSYGIGPSYQNPLQGYDQQGDMVGASDWPTIWINPACPGPQYNRPFKAAIDTVTHQPFLLQWGPRVGHTPAYPKTDTTIVLYREDFNCTVDTPFTAHPIPNCNTSLTKVAYYVFRTTQESYVQINTEGYWAAVYSGNARTDSASFASATPIQTCLDSRGQIQICKLQPGTYTLVVFASDAQNCTYVQPRIYIDQVGYARFDHAANAYDFGSILPDSIFHNGKAGDVNPINPGRAPSSDIFYCTTGAQQNDPVNATCMVDYLPSIYNTGNNNALYNTNTPTGGSPYYTARRNLWYSFVVEHGGNVTVRIDNKTIGKQQMPLPMAIYKSNVNGSLPFSTVVSTGQVDSTLSQGLSFVVNNFSYSPYCYTSNEVSFYREPCNPQPERYYVLVEVPSTYYYAPGSDPHVMQPNNQVELSIMLDSLNAILPQFDHYYQAGNIGANLTTGSYTGPTDNYSCATGDPTDPIEGYGSCANKTLWYKFSTTVTGKLKFRVKINNTSQYAYNYLQVFRQLVPGDSTSAGLQILNTSGTAVYDPATAAYWGQTCVSPGTYYIVLTGCYMVNEWATPEIILTEEAGDFCSAPMVASLNGSGTTLSTVTVDCHTIGTDYGEFNPTLTCPDGAARHEYKTSWFRVDITGTDTLDVTTYLTENTNALPSEIKYRMMNGDCGAMQEQSCVQDAQTQDTYKCLLPGKSYFFQVFTPVTRNGQPVVGSISLNLMAVPHADTCAPVQCLSNATFMYDYDCTMNDTVTFINYSTYGSQIQYEWNFGDGSPVSGVVAPKHKYAVLATDATYTATLTVTNLGCTGPASNQTTYSQQITIPGRPDVDLGSDTSFCTPGSTMTLDATTWNGATYQWYNGATTPTIEVSSPGTNEYWVTVNYNGCVRKDTITVNINPFIGVNQTHVACSPGSNYSFSNPAYGGYGETHTWSNGSSSYSISVSEPGTYYHTINWKGCTIIDTFTIAAPSHPFNGGDTLVCHPFNTFTLNATTPGANGYSWFDGTSDATKDVTQPGEYWVDIYYPGCTVRDTITVLAAPAPVSEQIHASVCSGQNYTLPWGGSANTSGTYSDTLFNENGCDSLIREVILTVVDPTTEISQISLCQGEDHILPWGEVVYSAGTYRDTLHSVAGCDSVYRIVEVSMNVVTVIQTNETVCQGQPFALPWGGFANQAGIYSDTIQHASGGCDSVIRHITLTVLPVIIQSADVTICSGSSYQLPWGGFVDLGGMYSDTIRYTGGCDSLIRHVMLSVTAPLQDSSSITICGGSIYTLPWGGTVNTTGIYRDTIRYVNGCDSLVRIVDLTVLPVTIENSSVTICEGQSYTLPWGTTVNTSGIYSDTIQYATGSCDSLITVVNLVVNDVIVNNLTASVCSGQSYTLPWGEQASAAGVYSDTLYYQNGCDSLVRNVTLSVNMPLVINIDTTICAGSDYTLPWGGTANLSGIYSDTIRYVNGCDSLVSTVNLVVNNVTIENSTVTICEGQSYNLPWSLTVSNSGIYSDTLRYPNGCDSLIRNVELIVNPVLTTTEVVTICSGQTYTLPWGGIVSQAGSYSDTLYYPNGCDSLISIVNVQVTVPLIETLSALVCSGQTYDLPWGTTASISGSYNDTLQNISGCDSLIRIVNLTVQEKVVQNTEVIICEGQSWQLPWGISVSDEGVYSDTLRYPSGCDSLIRNVTVTVNEVEVINTVQTICAGTNYTLPWGTVVSASGLYSDTLFYPNGCDSIIRNVTLVVQAPTTTNNNVIICSGQTHTLPWGITVSDAGVYTDTLYYTTGCDSLIRHVNLVVQSSSTEETNVTICQGQNYTLPWGQAVNTTGTYTDVLQYSSGCDSLVRIVHLTVQTHSVQESNVTICQGQSFTLPWGTVVSAAGTYSNTLAYTTGCDSLTRIVHLTVTPANVLTTSASICSDEFYTLPWGVQVNTGGTYRDTLVTPSGCISQVRVVNLTVNPQAVVGLSKSNDIDCILGTARLTASGGARYSWSPVSSLTNPGVYNPVASPDSTTRYVVEVTTDKGCKAKDSILLIVNKGDAASGFMVPSAFTPNRDGLNDCFGIAHWGSVKDFEMIVYNRWGQMMFYTTDPGRCWDGTYAGKDLGTATYVYVIKATTFCGPVLRKGTVILVR